MFLGIILTFLGLVGIALLLIFWRNPGSLLLVYVCALPFYTLSMAILFLLTGSVQLVNIVQPWKELLALLVIFLVALKVFLSSRISRLHFLDFLVLTYFGLNFLYLLVPHGTEFTVRLFGFRANTFWVVIYWLGRLVPISKKLQKWILASLVGVGFLAGIMTVVEVFFLPPDWPVRLGMMDYLREFFNVVSRGNYGLTWTFETATGIRRRSAFFANPLELASSTLVTGAAAFYLINYFKPRTRGKLLALISYGMITLSLLLSVSRASMVAFFVQLLIMSVWFRKRILTFFIGGVGILGIIIVLFFAGDSITEFVVDTITFENPSSRHHLEQWILGAEAIIDNPLGLGLGSSGRIGDRFGSQTGGENQFVVVGVDLGVMGLLLYIAILLSVIKYAFQTLNKTRGVTKALVFVAAMAKFGLLIPTFTSHIEVYVFAMFTTWWLVGFSVQQLMRSSPVQSPAAFRKSSQETLIANSH
jgi:hypothetical protein